MFNYNLKTKDVGDVLQIGKLAIKLEDVHFVASTLHKYKPKNGEEWKRKDDEEELIELQVL